MKKLSDNDAFLQLNELITRIPEFKSFGSDRHPDFYNWRKQVVSLLVRQLGANSKEVADFSGINFRQSLGDRLYNLDVSTNFLSGLKAAKSLLVKICDEWNIKARKEEGCTKKKLRLLMNPWTITIVGGLIVAFLRWMFFKDSENSGKTTEDASTQKQTMTICAPMQNNGCINNFNITPSIEKENINQQKGE